MGSALPSTTHPAIEMVMKTLPVLCSLFLLGSAADIQDRFWGGYGGGWGGSWGGSNTGSTNAWLGQMVATTCSSQCNGQSCQAQSCMLGTTNMGICNTWNPNGCTGLPPRTN